MGIKNLFGLIPKKSKQIVVHGMNHDIIITVHNIDYGTIIYDILNVISDPILEHAIGNQLSFTLDTPEGNKLVIAKRDEMGNFIIDGNE